VQRPTATTLPRPLFCKDEKIINSWFTINMSRLKYLDVVLEIEDRNWDTGGVEVTGWREAGRLGEQQNGVSIRI
jgi:hypothetical protein